MSRTYEHTLAFLLSSAWQVRPQLLQSAADVLAMRITGQGSDRDQVAAIVGERDARQERRRAAWASGPGYSQADEERGYFLRGSVAVVPVSGILSKYANLINGMSQPEGMTTDQVAESIRRAGADRSARSVLMDIDSPGGTAAGASDMGEAVREVRANGKPIIAMIRDMAASSAYRLAAQADAVHTTPDGLGGSIGTYAVVEDSSEALSKQGITRYLVASGVHKGAGARGTKVTGEHLQSIGEEIAGLTRAFVADVAAGRDMPEDEVEQLATGRTWIGKGLVEAGLADSVTTFGDLIEAMNRESAAAVR